jgi:hypothetical protein
MATYNDKLLAVRRFVEENFDDAGELTVALGLTVEDMVKLLPDVLVANYNNFMEAYDYSEEEQEDDESEDDGIGDEWEE